MKKLYLVKETQKNEQTGAVYTYCLASGGYVHEWANADIVAEILAMVEEVSKNQRYIEHDIKRNDAIIEQLKGGAKND